MEFELKPLTEAGITLALARAEKYRLLNEPVQAESICLDILRVDPKHQEAIIFLLLSLADQFVDSVSGNLERALALLPRLEEEYHRIYYHGLLCERQARIHLRRGAPGSKYAAFDLFSKAMHCYEKAEQVRPSMNDEALLRWNTCARAIMSSHLEPQPADDSATLMLE